MNTAVVTSTLFPPRLDGVQILSRFPKDVKMFLHRCYLQTLLVLSAHKREGETGAGRKAVGR